jgi:hypothetical protein
MRQALDGPRFHAWLRLAVSVMIRWRPAAKKAMAPWSR